MEDCSNRLGKKGLYNFLIFLQENLIYINSQIPVVVSKPDQQNSPDFQLILKTVRNNLSSLDKIYNKFSS